jgi:hypothetical protein
VTRATDEEQKRSSGDGGLTLEQRRCFCLLLHSDKRGHRIRADDVARGGAWEQRRTPRDRPPTDMASRLSSMKGRVLSRGRWVSLTLLVTMVLVMVGFLGG